MRYALIGVGICLLFCADLHASRTYPPTYNEMFDWFQADALVRAEVKEKEALFVTVKHIDEYWRQVEYERIYTRYRMILKDVVTGDAPPDSFYLYMAGGEVDGTHMSSSSSFEFQTGWDVVLFLQHNVLNDMYFSAGSEQTVFVVHEVEDTAVLINLRNGYPPTQPIAEDDLTLQEHLDKDERIYGQGGSGFLSYGVLKASYQDAQQ